jgi:integrase
VLYAFSTENRTRLVRWLPMFRAQAVNIADCRRPKCEAAGLQGIGFHSLRRASATALVQARVDLKTAQTRPGHSDPRVTLSIYAQAVAEADRSAAEVFGAHFLPQSSNAPDEIAHESRTRDEE